MPVWISGLSIFKEAFGILTCGAEALTLGALREPPRSAFTSVPGSPMDGIVTAAPASPDGLFRPSLGRSPLRVGPFILLPRPFKSPLRPFKEKDGGPADASSERSFFRSPCNMEKTK